MRLSRSDQVGLSEAKSAEPTARPRAAPIRSKLCVSRKRPAFLEKERKSEWLSKKSEKRFLPQSPIPTPQKFHPPQPPRFLLYYKQHTPVSLRRESAALKVRGVFFTMTKLPSYSKPALTVGEQVKLLIGRGLVCVDSSQLECAVG